MAGKIVPKRINGKEYYYFHTTYREKIDPTKSGKSKGSGKSRVRSKSVYLGTAESILEFMNKTRSPIEVKHREFGFVMAAYQTALEIGLADLLKEHIPGVRYKVPRWIYFMISIINRLQHSTSKEKMGDWAGKTVLPDILHFDANRLNSQSFWYATDDVLNEKALQQKRQKNPGLNDDIFTGLDDSLFQQMEDELFRNLKEKLDLSWDIFLYDTTNFFTYLSGMTLSKLARTGHNKAYRHHCKQVGLALCVEKEWGIPLFHRMYRGNSQDSSTFSQVIDSLLTRFNSGFEQINDLVLVLDKGNNSEKNFDQLKDKLKWVGSLVLSHHADLMDLPLDAYSDSWEGVPYYRSHREVMGVRCVLILTYNEKLARRQEHTLQRGLEKLKQQIKTKWKNYKKRPTSIPKGITRLIKESHYGKFLRVIYEDEQLSFHLTEKVENKRKTFGKCLLFSNDCDAESGWIISQYHSKNKIEEGFKLLKDPSLIRWRPARHWTDTKIRAFGFCCVMALVLIRVMELKAAQAGLRMSPTILKEELTDLKEIIMIYDDRTADMKISHRSSVQEKLWELFNLKNFQNQLPLH